MNDRAAFTRALHALSPLTPAELEPAFAIATALELDAGEALLRAGERATTVVVVARGLLREHFVLEDGTERTKAFVREGELSGSLADLLSPAASRAFITADEPTRVVACEFAALRALAERSPGWARLSRAALERLVLAKAEREWELLGLDAEGRYRAFCQRYPGLEQRTLAKHVASYLGVTPVHLSRLRRRRAKR